MLSADDVWFVIGRSHDLPYWCQIRNAEKALDQFAIALPQSAIGDAALFAAAQSERASPQFVNRLQRFDERAARVARRRHFDARVQRQ